jgi:protein-tyrosine-phosphatase
MPAWPVGSLSTVPAPVGGMSVAQPTSVLWRPSAHTVTTVMITALARLMPAGLPSFDPASSPNDLDVPDPYYGGTAGFDHVLSLVEAACEGLIDQLPR